LADFASAAPQSMGDQRLALLSPRAYQVLKQAEEDARQSQHDCVGVDNLLIAIARHEHNRAAHLLRSKNLDPDLLCRALQRLLPRGSKPLQCDDFPFTPRLQRVFTYATEEAEYTCHANLTPEHLLLGLLREPDSPAVVALQDLGMDPNAIRRELTKLLWPS
jgi:ATP-dependent Clp protease ATP-binding subunit ClpC